ncbi:hypothetical protein BDW71DRAFT_185716 [Aspergillus fruticulosus]
MADKPPLPTKNDGSVHITNIHKEVKNLRGNVPCASYGNCNDCCKDVNVCEHFLLFNCGDIHPTPRRSLGSGGDEPTG